ASFAAFPRFSTAFVYFLNLFEILTYCAGRFDIIATPLFSRHQEASSKKQEEINSPYCLLPAACCSLSTNLFAASKASLSAVGWLRISPLSSTPAKLNVS